MSFPRWRTLAGVTLAVFGAATTAQVASAAPVDMVQELKVTITPGKSGTAKKPRAAAIGVTIQSPTEEPATTESVRLLLGKGIKINNTAFPTCSASLINANKSIAKCPKGSIVGRGTARAVGFLGGAKVPETLSVTAINSDNNSLQLYVSGTNPLRISGPITGKLSKASGKYGYRLDVTIPKYLREVIPGVYAPLVYFEVDVKATTTVTKGKGKKAKKVKVNYIETTSCPSGGWPFEAGFVFDQAAPFTADPLTAVSPASTCS